MNGNRKYVSTLEDENTNIATIRGENEDGSLTKRCMKILMMDKNRMEEFINIKINTSETPYAKAKRIIENKEKAS